MTNRNSWELSSHPSKSCSNLGMTLNGKLKRAIPFMGSFSRCWNSMQKLSKLWQWGWDPSICGTPWPWSQMCINPSVLVNDDGQGIEICKPFPPCSTGIKISSIRSDTPVGSKKANEHRASFEMGSFHSRIICMGRKWSGKNSWTPEGISDSIFFFFFLAGRKICGNDFCWSRTNCTELE